MCGSAFGQISDVKTSSTYASSSSISTSLVARGGVFLGGRHDHWWWWLTPVDPLIGAQCPPWPFANCGWLLALAVLASSSGAGTPLTCLLLRACSNTQFLPFLSFYSFSFSSPFLLIFLSQSSYLVSFSPFHLISDLLHFQELRAAPC